MSRILAIAARDVQALYRTPRGIVLLALMNGIWGFYFFNILGRYNFLIARASGMQLQSDFKVPTLHEFLIQPYYSLVLVSMALVVALFSMRSFPEEREQGTLELLLTSPGRTSELVWGKYLALLFPVALACVGAGIFPLMLGFWGSPDLGVILSGVLGLFLCSAAFAGLALGVAAFCERQLSAAVVNAILLSSLLLLHTPASLLPARWRGGFELVSAYLEASQFIDGYISAQGICYFIILASLGLRTVPLGLRRADRSNAADFFAPLKSAWFSAALIAGAGAVSLFFLQRGQGSILLYAELSAMLIFLAFAWRRASHIKKFAAAYARALLRLAILALLFALAARSGLFIDASSVRTFQLSPYTQAVLQRLPYEVKIRYVLKDSPQEDLRTKRILELYQANGGGRIKVEQIDPLEFPQLSTSLGISPYDALQLVWTADGSERRSSLPRLDESALAAALQTVSSNSRDQVYLLQGLGAPLRDDAGPYGLSAFSDKLEQEGFEVVPWIPQMKPDALKSAKLLVIVGPRERPPGEFLDQLQEFLVRGGKLLLALDPPYTSPYASLFQQLGVEISNEIVVDGDQRSFSRGSAGFQPLVTRRSDHPLVNRLGGSGAVLFNISAPVRGIPNQSSTYSSRELLWVSPGSSSDSEIISVLSGKKSISSLAASKDPIAVLAAAEDSRSSSRAVLVGDSDWMLNAAISFYDNGELSLNSLHWLRGDSWALVERARTEVTATVAVSDHDLSVMMILALLTSELLLFYALYRHRKLSLPA